MWISQNRRQVLSGIAAFGTSTWIGPMPGNASEGPPETTTVRLPAFPGQDCLGPMYIASDLLRQEGMTGVDFVSSGTGPDSLDWLANGELDFDWNFVPSEIRAITSGVPLTVLAGMHIGCLELIASTSVRSVPDLKGKTVGVDALDGHISTLLRLITAYVGLDPEKDFEWVEVQDSVESLADGKIDAFMGVPPQPQNVRERNIGHVILKTSFDRPWSQYYCCALCGATSYVQSYPNATKRVMRALLKAVDLCASEPKLAADLLMKTGLGSNYEYALETLGSDSRFDVWREYDTEDSIRFYALRMKEAGEIAMSPLEVIARGTDWRIIGELRRELKG